MAWRRPGDKPLSEPVMVRLLTQICVTRPQWVNQNDCLLTNTNKQRYSGYRLRSHMAIIFVYWPQKTQRSVMKWNETKLQLPLQPVTKNNCLSVDNCQNDNSPWIYMQWMIWSSSMSTFFKNKWFRVRVKFAQCEELMKLIVVSVDIVFSRC